VGTVYLSPNNFKNVPATVFMHNGDTMHGALTLNNEVLVKKIKLKRATDNEETKFHLLEMTSYKIGEDSYELKHRMGGGVGKADYFMKRLTPATSAIHLYEHKEKYYQNKGKSAAYKTKYFIQFPNEHRNAVWALDGHRLIPHFHQKMSEVVATCPALAEKIKGKEKGYTYQQLDATEKERYEVVMRIINEYNSCRK
jgi:hypothetical protein